MKVWVETPEIAGEHVRFRWRQSAPNPFQRVNEYFFRYEDLDLAVFSPSLFTEMFLALQLKVFAAWPEPVELHFSEPVPAPSAAYWLAFHHAERVTVGPLADVASYDPLRKPIGDPNLASASAVFFGGGKDSTLDAALFAELFGPDQVTLIQYIGPLKPGLDRFAAIEQRQTTLMLRPVQTRLGVKVQRVWTDYQAIFLEAGFPARPHLEFYTAGALPALIARSVRVSTFGSTRLDHPILTGTDGRRIYVRPRSRPEFLATQSAHYRRALGFDHTLANINFPLSTVMDFQVLHERYPDLAPEIVMCTRAHAGERWCYDCGKCRDYALYGLGCGYVDPRFDYDRFLSRSQAVQRIVEFSADELQVTESGNARWRPGVMHPSVFAAVCHSLARTDPTILKGRIGKTAAANLRLMLALYGNERFPAHETVAAEIVDFVGLDVLRQTAALASEHFATAATLPGPELYGDQDAIIDYVTRMPAYSSLVSHIHTPP